METSRHTLYLTLLLTSVAGYCDTATFVAADELFSAHVTGNFIVFAYDLVRHADAQSWQRLLSFPVFVAAVVAGRWANQRAGRRYALLRLEGLVLLGAAGLALLNGHPAGRALPWLAEVAAMSVVFAMGLQNTFGKLFGKETLALTTVMTGNVTQATLDVAEWLTAQPAEPVAPGPAGSQGAAVSKQLWTIAGFLGGCLAGGFAAHQFGLGVVAAPGLLLVGFVAAYNPRKDAAG